MRSSSSELLLDQQQQELRKRKLIELAQPKKLKKPKRTCRQRLWFYLTSFLALAATGAGSSLLFLVPLYVDPAISTLTADFVSAPVRCTTVRHEQLTGMFNCTWSSCREGCTSDMYACSHIFVSYTTTPFDVGGRQNATTTTPPPSGENVTDEAVLYVNIKGCGYPPDVDCKNFTATYGELDVEFPCYYSRENRTVVMAHYDREEQVTVIVHYFAVPFVVTIATSVALCVMYCDCRCASGRSRRRHHRRPVIEDASDGSISTRVDMLTPQGEASRPL